MKYQDLVRRAAKTNVQKDEREEEEEQEKQTVIPQPCDIGCRPLPNPFKIWCVLRCPSPKTGDHTQDDGEPVLSTGGAVHETDKWHEGYHTAQNVDVWCVEATYWTKWLFLLLRTPISWTKMHRSAWA